MHPRILTFGCALALVLAGCAQIPRSGAVVEGARVDAPADSRGLEPVAVGPVAGATAKQIVAGTVAAMVSSEDEYDVARRFLSGSLATRWEPRRQTLVFDGEPHIVLRSSGARSRVGALTVRVVATVGPDGRYHRVTPRVRRIPVTVGRQPGGAWRVTRFPDLTLIAAGDFTLSFRAHPVYFLDQGGSALVPAQRYLSNGDGLAARLASAVLDGPSAATRSGYGTAGPAGVAPASSDAVTTDGETAVVALTAQARSASPQQLAALTAQLLATLRGVLPVTSVRLTVGGEALSVPSQPSFDVIPAATDLPVLLRAARLWRFDGEHPTRVSGVPDLAAAQPDAVAQSPGGSRFAVTGHQGGRLYLVGAGRPLGHSVLTGTSLSDPSFDAAGWVYTSSSPSPGFLEAVSPRGTHRQVGAAWLRGRTVRSARVSPDGGFMAVVSASSPAGTGRLDVVPLRRDGATPSVLSWTPADTRSLPGEDIHTAAWRSSTELAVATDAGPGTLPVDGPLTSSGDIARVVQFAPGTGSGIGDLALTAGDRLYQYSTGRWYRVRDVTGVHSIAASG